MAAHGQTTSPIQLDESQTLIVIYCTEHDWYRASRFHREDALDAACGHEEREHPMDNRHRDARRVRTSRRVASAARSSVSETGSRV